MKTYNFVHTRFHRRCHGWLEPVNIDALPADVQNWLGSRRYRYWKRSFHNCKLADAVFRSMEGSSLLIKRMNRFEPL